MTQKEFEKHMVETKQRIANAEIQNMAKRKRTKPCLGKKSRV